MEFYFRFLCLGIQGRIYVTFGFGSFRDWRVRTERRPSKELRTDEWNSWRCVKRLDQIDHFQSDQLADAGSV